MERELSVMGDCQCSYTLHNEPVTQPKQVPKLKWTALLKDTTRGPHGARAQNLGIMSSALYHGIIRLCRNFNEFDTIVSI